MESLHTEPRDRPVIEVTPAMIEAGVNAYFMERVEDQLETFADCREVVRAILLAGLLVHQEAR